MAEPDKLSELNKEELLKRVKALEQQIEDRKRIDAVVASTARKGIFRILAGGRLYRSIKQAWTAWLAWSRTDRKGTWPEEETGDMIAAVGARLLRIGLVGLLLILVQPVTLIWQTRILSQQSDLISSQNEQITLQTQQLDNQNREFERQNTLLAFEQTSRFREMLYEPPTDTFYYQSPHFPIRTIKLRWPAPDPGVMRQLINLGQTESKWVRAALEPLLKDDAVSVSSGALLVLASLSDSVKAPRALLSGATLVGANLRNVELPNAYLSKADLWGVILAESNISGADLKEAGIYDANLSGANLTGTNLSEANLRHANLTGAILSEAIFTNTDLSRAVLSGADLSEAKNLTMQQLCSAYDLTNIKPDTLYNKAKDSCPPEKFNSPRPDWLNDR